MQGVTNRLPRYGVAVFTTAAASLFALFLAPLSLRVPFALFAAAVILSSLEGGLKPGLLATALSTVALAVEFWLLPLAQLPENQDEVVPLLVMFIIIGLLSNYLGEQCWRAVHAAESSQAAVAQIRDTEEYPEPVNSVVQVFTGWNPQEATEEMRGPIRSRRDGKAIRSEPRNGSAPTLRERINSATGLRLRSPRQRKQAEPELRQREEQFRSLAACAPASILQMDPDCRCVYANCAAQLLGGFSAEEGQGDGWARYVHPEDRVRVVAGWAAAMQAGREFACELRFLVPRRVNGTFAPTDGQWVRLRSSPMVSDLGKLIGHVAVLQEIDGQKLAEEALRQTRTLVTAVARSLGQGQACQSEVG
ncbi:MAG TPA: PAS domain-containing protein [Gemmataceae bacterium]|nr:PAS domain-containing protein [Gemmataceae bacterium]